MFLTRLDNALFALNQNDLFAFKDISAQIISHVPDSIRLKSNYLSWYTVHTLAWEDRFEPALIKLKEATEFKASTSLLRTFKAKIFSDIGSVHLALGNFKEALKMFK